MSQTLHFVDASASVEGRMESRDLFALFDRAGDAAFAVEPYGSICYWSESAEKLLGFSRAKALTKHCADIIEGYDDAGCRVLRRGLPRPGDGPKAIRHGRLRPPRRNGLGRAEVGECHGDRGRRQFRPLAACRPPDAKHRGAQKDRERYSGDLGASGGAHRARGPTTLLNHDSSGRRATRS